MDRKLPPNATSTEVRRFFDSYGWRIGEAGGKYLSEILYGDHSEISQEYDEGCEARYRGYFAAGGGLFLDAGCGALPLKRIGQNFERHVCVDISIAGLMAAKQQLGSRGLYVVADLNALPFRNESFDGVAASYCLYHVDKELQTSALEELYRVTRTHKNILVFSIARHSLVSLAHRMAKAVWRLGRRLMPISPKSTRRDGGSIGSPLPLYCYPQSPRLLTKGFRAVDITCLRTLTRVEAQALRKLRLLKPAVRLLSFLEERLPHAMRLIGAYVAIRIQRTE